MISLVAVAAVILSGVEGWAADVAGVRADFARLAASAKVGAGGAYGHYDALSVFSNPALLAGQRSRFEAAASDRIAASGEGSLWSLGAAWAGPETDRGATAAAVIASGLAAPPFQEADLDGTPLGPAVTPLEMNLGAAVGWRKGGFGAGVAGRYIEERLDVPGLPAYHATALDIGLVDVAGTVQVGAAVRGLGHAAVANAGLAWRLPGAPFVADAEWNDPLAGGFANELRGGVTWRPLPQFDLRAGGGVAGSERSAGAGFTLRLGRAWLDYVFSAPLSGGFGSSHLLGLGLSAGPPR